MRTRWKFMGAVLAVVMILSSLSMTVLADNPIECGSVQGQFNWDLYMDGTMYVTAHTNHINLADITDNDVKRAVDCIKFDISEPAADPSTKYIRIEGRGVGAEKLEYIGGEGKYFESVSIYMLENLQEIDFPEGVQIQSLVITGAAFDNIDFLDDLDHRGSRQEGDREELRDPDDGVSDRRLWCFDLRATCLRGALLQMAGADE